MPESLSLRSVTQIRCSDSDRERTGERLRDAAGEGRLTMAELEERIGDVYAARYQDELDILVTDLPRPADRRTTGWLAVLAAVWAQLGADLALLSGRAGAGWSRRRLVLAAVLALLLAAMIATAFHDFGRDGFAHHAFGHIGAVEGVVLGS
jgi:hypothetical protein